MNADAEGNSGAVVSAQSREGSPVADDFVPSALGTREHWDAVYERELKTFQDYGATGEIWFGEESMYRVIRWMQKHKIPLDASVLDIGTGNGVFLVELVEDFLNLSTKLSGFHVCVDKGTYDAISLNPDNAVEKRKQYVMSLSRVLEVKGFFLITSCNWTKAELLDAFSEGFELFEELPTPKFSFGGRCGNTVAALVFQKRETSLDKVS
ncbi:EEF1A lysine methyltransferase 2 isoform X2 [Rattus norvegicus]|uniref:EEF1A lysine methyltransferase 2 isoform X2 n=1 Tax=Rattus norvegicus TaxID=10116 RepID=UPI001917725E|nr:EEF1A lysine methyltransferase 2 isoform X2 [Rattus norvegicus]